MLSSRMEKRQFSVVTGVQCAQGIMKRVSNTFPSFNIYTLDVEGSFCCDHIVLQQDAWGCRAEHSQEFSLTESIWQIKSRDEEK